jgi:hypothetical protein
VANDVAVTLKFAGKLDEAEHLYRRALAILERELGPDHPDLATLSTTSAGSPTRAATTPRPVACGPVARAALAVAPPCPYA